MAQGKRHGLADGRIRYASRIYGEESPRETKGRKGRSQEIERLIGRSLRNVCDMANMGGEVTMTIDCDVLPLMLAVRAPRP